MTADSPDRTILKNCHRHSAEECNAAAERMARCSNWTDRELGRLWLAACALA